MNWSRGLFRLWVLGSVLWVTFSSLMSWEEVSREFRNANTDWSKTGTLMVPVDCSKARGKEGTDYEKRGPWQNYTTRDLCWYQEPKLRALFPEYADLSEKELGDKLYDAADIVRNKPQPWTKLLEALGMAFFPPVVVLAFGCALLWALRGFKRGIQT